MNYKAIIKINGKILILVSALMLPAMLISLFCGEREAAIGILISAAITAAFGAAGSLIKSDGEINAGEGIIAVGFAWILVSLFGALPYKLSGSIPKFIDCFFETVSGFTTTGSSILSEIESLPKGILYWRSFSQWLGGMGVLVFILAFAALTNKNSGESMHLLRAESPGIRTSKLVPRMKRSSAILYGIYFGMTIAQFLLLILGSVPVFDSLTISFATAGTGGFSIRNDSFASYSSYAKWVTTVFMLLYGVNFSIYYMLLLGKIKKAISSEELRNYLLIVLIAIAAICINCLHIFASAGENIREVAFTVVSVITTTGFVSANYDLWPVFSRTILVLIMLCGAMAGSTGGGMKVVRITLAFKAVRKTVYKALHPNAVNVMRMDGEIVSDDEIDAVEGFFILYFIIAAAACLIISIDGKSLMSNLTAVITCLSNVGPGMEEVGATANFASFSPLSKLILSICMLTGRLELFPIIALIMPSSYKK